MITEEAGEPAGVQGEEEAPEIDRDAGLWLKMIEHASQAFDQWNKTCDNLAKDFANLKRLASMRSDREFQMFYANLEVVKPSIYSRAPQPVVVPRFKDRKPVPRKASEILERAMVTSFDVEKVHDTLKKVRDDLALFGRGVVWTRFEIYQKADEIKECVRYEWVHRRDFLHEPARVWPEVGWVARGTWLTREQGEKRFGEEAWSEITYEEAKDTADEYKVEKKARVWELWHKGKNLVVWLHPNKKQVLDIAEPHLNLDGFFPCPKPAYATVEEDSLVPVPDGCFYKDQLEEINELTARISALSESLKLAVFYPAGAEGVGEAVETALAVIQNDNRRTFVPLPGLGQMALGGSKLSDALWVLPVKDVAETITQLIALRRQLIEDVYQISGVSDIMRGETDANETLGAQQLKSQYGSIRIKDRQNEMVRVCDGILNLAGEIMAENFSAQTILSMSQTTDLPKQADVLAQHQQAMEQEIQAAIQQVQAGMAQGQPPPSPDQVKQAQEAIVLKHRQEVEQVVTIEKVFALFKAERVRPFVLQIATDSTIQPDENAEKRARNEFGAAFAQATTALAPLVQTAPAESADFVGEMLKFMMAPYRAGRPMEQAIDDFVERMKEKAQQPPPPSPEMMKAEAEANKLKLEGQKLEADLANAAEERKARTEEQTRQAAIDERNAMMQAAQDARDAQVKDRETQARIAEIDRKVANDEAQRKHDEEMRRMEYELKKLDIEKAKLSLQQQREKPKPTANGAEAH